MKTISFQSSLSWPGRAGGQGQPRDGVPPIKRFVLDNFVGVWSFVSNGYFYVKAEGRKFSSIDPCQFLGPLGVREYKFNRHKSTMIVSVNKTIHLATVVMKKIIWRWRLISENCIWMKRGKRGLIISKKRKPVQKKKSTKESEQGGTK